jgi:Ulp1 family protease
MDSLPYVQSRASLSFSSLSSLHAPSQNHGQQTNGHDCGLWVLCTLAAVMRGFAGAEVYEGDMPTVCTLFADLIRTLPIT